MLSRAPHCLIGHRASLAASGGVLFGLLVLTGCGSDKIVDPPPPTPTPVPPAQAVIDISQSSTAQLCISPVPDEFFRLALPVRVTETAGLPANGNFARLQLFLGASEVERIELGVNELITAFGSNFLPANGSLSGTLNFDFSSTDFDSRQLTINFIDAHGNSLNTTIGDIDLETVIFCSALKAQRFGDRISLQPPD